MGASFFVVRGDQGEYLSDCYFFRRLSGKTFFCKNKEKKSHIFLNETGGLQKWKI